MSGYLQPPSEEETTLNQQIIGSIENRLAKRHGLPLEVIKHITKSWPIDHVNILLGANIYRAVEPIYDGKSVYPVGEREVACPNAEQLEKGLPAKRKELLEQAYFEVYGEVTVEA